MVSAREGEETKGTPSQADPSLPSEPTTAQFLAGYRPVRLSEMQWAPARELTVSAVLATGYQNRYAAHSLLSLLAQFLLWHPEWQPGTTPDLKKLLHPAQLAAFSASSSKYRRGANRLSGVARAVGAIPEAPPLARVPAHRRRGRIWLASVELGPFNALATAYARLRQPMVGSEFAELSDRLIDRRIEGVVANAPADALDNLAVVSELLRRLREAPDVELSNDGPSSTAKHVKKRAMTKSARATSRTANVKAAKAAARLNKEIANPTVDAAAIDLTRLPKEVATAIAQYRPYRVAEAQWLRVAVAARTIATAYGPVNARWVQDQMGGMVRFCLWVLSREGRQDRSGDLEITELLEPGLADLYVTTATGHLSDPSRATLRSILRRGTKRLAPQIAPARIAYHEVRGPYSPFECASFVRLARHQPTVAARRNLSSLVALGLGAGCSPSDLRHIAPCHVHEIELDEQRALAVQITGSNPRTVIVRSEYDNLLREAITCHRDEGRGENQPLCGDAPERHNVSATATSGAKTAGGTGVDISLSRLRSTWLAALMCAAVPLGTLLYVAGLRSARTLVDLLAYCPDPDFSEVERALGVMKAALEGPEERS